MGWASGGEIFDGVAQTMIDIQADEGAKRFVLGRLIDSLQAQDWDTEDESLEQFSSDPVIVDLFRERGIAREDRDS